MVRKEPIAWIAFDSPTEVYFNACREKLPYRLYESAMALYAQDYVLDLEIQIKLKEKTIDDLLAQNEALKNELKLIDELVAGKEQKK